MHEICQFSPVQIMHSEKIRNQQIFKIDRNKMISYNSDTFSCCTCSGAFCVFNIYGKVYIQEVFNVKRNPSTNKARLKIKRNQNMTKQHPPKNIASQGLVAKVCSVKGALGQYNTTQKIRYNYDATYDFWLPQNWGTICPSEYIEFLHIYLYGYLLTRLKVS